MRRGKAIFIGASLAHNLMHAEACRRYVIRHGEDCKGYDYTYFPMLTGYGTDVPAEAGCEGRLSTGKLALALLVALVFPLGTLAVAVYGLSVYLSKKGRLTWHEMRPQYVMDLDSSIGSSLKQIGEVRQKQYVRVKATPEMLHFNKLNGKLLMLMAGAAFLIWVVLLLTV